MRTGEIIHRFTSRDGRMVVLRTPKWEDLDDLIEYINSLVVEGAHILKTQKVTRDEEADWLGKILAEMEKTTLFMMVAEVDGKVVAGSEIQRREGSSSHVANLGIGIRDGYRDVGIGTEMLRALIGQAEKMGLRLLTLDAFSTNRRAIHVYEKVGFRETGRRPKFFYRNGEFIDEIIMMREIQ